MRLTKRPMPPMMNRRSGSDTSEAVARRCKASMKIVKQSAVRKTALTKAPSTSARTQPYVFCEECHWATCRGGDEDALASRRQGQP